MTNRKYSKTAFLENERLNAIDQQFDLQYTWLLSCVKNHYTEMNEKFPELNPIEKSIAMLRSYDIALREGTGG